MPQLVHERPPFRCGPKEPAPRPAALLRQPQVLRCRQLADLLARVSADLGRGAVVHRMADRDAIWNFRSGSMVAALE